MSSSSHSISEPTSSQALRRKIRRASWLSGLLWLGLGTLLILFIQQQPWLSAFSAEYSYFSQLLAGSGAGLAAGNLAVRMMQMKAFRNISRDYPIVGLIRQADLKRGDILSISVVAGISEEWLFRAALQPLLGLWISSFIFVALHGYFKFKNAAQIFFGVFMLLLSLLLGLLFEYIGLLSAIAAHILYDIVVTHGLRTQGKNEES
ncbi:MAG: CPBP family intramembrane glutamic endopeptidase [Cyclonatronaceae bacterium]